jgi:hypothetical protein
MAHASQFLSPTRGRLIAVLLTAAAAVILLFSIQGSIARAEINDVCKGGVFCAFTGTFFSGEDSNFGCGGGFLFPSTEWRSAKNNCSVNFRIGWYEGGTTNWKACMSPGGERPEPGRFNEGIPNAC